MVGTPHAVSQSVHVFIAQCVTHPLHKAWLAAWGPFNPAHHWRTYAQKRDIFLTGKLAIPESLFGHLRGKLGTKGAKKDVASFQSRVLDLLTEALPPLPADYRPPRPSPYNIADWDITRAPPPTRKRKVFLAVD